MLQLEHDALALLDRYLSPCHKSVGGRRNGRLQLYGVGLGHEKGIEAINVLEEGTLA
jgi:hypothetical protein